MLLLFSFLFLRAYHADWLLLLQIHEDVVKGRFPGNEEFAIDMMAHVMQVWRTLAVSSIALNKMDTDGPPKN